MARFEDVGPGRFKAFAIAFGDRIADVFSRRSAVVAGKQRTCRQPDDVERKWHQSGLVEVVGTPDQSTLDITPGPEIFEMRIADG